LADPEAVAEAEVEPADDADADADDGDDADVDADAEAVAGADTAADGLGGAWAGVPPVQAAVARQTEIATPAISGVRRGLGRSSVDLSFITQQLRRW
jgi:hypothetical protein